MHVTFEINGSFVVPDGTEPVAEMANHFRLPSGEIISVHPVIEMESAPDRDDHRDLSYSEAVTLGVCLDFYDRSSELETED